MNNHNNEEEEIIEQPLNDEGWAELIRNCDFYIDVKNLQRTMLFNTETGEMISGVKEQIIDRVFEPTEKRFYYDNNVKLAEFHYDPYAKGPLSLNPNGGERFNVYQPPTWRRENYFKKVPLPAKPDKLPELFERFLDHYTANNTASKEYVLDWSANLLHRRNYTFKTSVGDAGVGKGRYGDIMRHIVGHTNFVKVRDEIFKSKFNGQLKNKQLVHVDEFSIENKEAADRCKDLANPRIEIESKGVDAEEVDNFASFYFSSNRRDSVKIEPSDRRFSIIQLTDKSLVDVMTIEEITKLEDPALIEQVALYLWYRDIQGNMFKPFRSARFEDIREASLNTWELYLFEVLLPEHEIGAKIDLPYIQNQITAKHDFIRTPPGRSKFEEFVKKFPESLRFGRNSTTGVRYIEIIGTLKSAFEDKEETK